MLRRINLQIGQGDCLAIVGKCLIAFAAGALPAFRASRLNPIEALRYE